MKSATRSPAMAVSKAVEGVAATDAVHPPAMKAPARISPANVAVLAAVFSAVAIPSLATAPVNSAILGLSLVVGSLLVWLSAIDLATERLPDRFTFPLFAIGLLAAGIDGPESAGWAALAGVMAYLAFAGLAAGYLRIRRQAGLGMGDAKLLAAGGTLVGFEGLPSVVLIGSLLALVFAFFNIVRYNERAMNSHIPFGPFLAFGIWCVWLHGPLALL